MSLLGHIRLVIAGEITPAQTWSTGVSLTGAVSYAITRGVLWHLSGRPAGLERTIFDRVIAPALVA